MLKFHYKLWYNVLLQSQKYIFECFELINDNFGIASKDFLYDFIFLAVLFIKKELISERPNHFVSFLLNSKQLLATFWSFFLVILPSKNVLRALKFDADFL
jgi:hypothetical protein